MSDAGRGTHTSEPGWTGHDPAVHATPEEALEAFLEGPQVPSAEFDGPSGRQLRQPTIARRGYDEFRLGDGTIAYKIVDRQLRHELRLDR
jgi:hypothetical protein